MITSNSVIVSMKLCLDVGNDEYIPLYFTSLPPPQEAKKKNGLNRVKGFVLQRRSEGYKREKKYV